MGNMETLEDGTLYIKNDDGSMNPLGNISDALIATSSPKDDSKYEFKKEFIKLSETAFKATCVISEFGWHLRKYSVNNWRRNHGLPLIRRRKKYGKRF